MRKAHLVFTKLLKILQRPYFVISTGAQDGHVMGGIDPAPDSIPEFYRYLMRLVPGEIACKQCLCLNVYQLLSP